MIIVYVPFINIIFNVLIILTVGVVFSIVKRKNPISAIFIFITLAFIIYGLLFFIGAEFIALVVLIIYTGVIAVLFLFTVLIYNLHSLNLVSVTASLTRFQRYAYRIVVVVLVLILKNPFAAVAVGFNNSERAAHARHDISIDLYDICNGEDMDETIISVYVEDVSQLSIMFNQHGVLLLTCGLLLFIAMIGSIAITYPFSKDLIK